MTRYLKALGLVAFAALTMSAMFASAASAEGTKGFYAAGTTPNFETSTLVGEQYDDIGKPWNFFETEEGIVTCDNATFTSTILGGKQSELTVTPHYEECQVTTKDPEPVTSPTTVTMNGCDFIFTQPTTAKDVPAGSYTAKVALTCPQEKKIEIHVYLFGNSTTGNHSFNVCTIEVYPNEPVTGEGEAAHRVEEYGGNSHVTLDTTEEVVNEEEVDDVTIAATVEGISYTDHCNNHNGEDGIYKNTVTATAWNDDEEPHDKVRDAWIEKEEE